MNRICSIAVACVISCWYLHAQTSNPEITADELKAHIKYLASDELEGRASGSEGNRKAVAYIARLMKQSGLQPGGDNGSYFQEFEFVSALKLGTHNSVAFEFQGKHSELVTDVDFRPFGFSSTATVSAPLVFVGYGISTTELKYDDYKDIDVTGKVVVAFRYSPEGNSPHSDFNKYSALYSKARTARDKGANALILVTGPADGDDDIVKLSFDNAFASSGIPAVSMKRSVLENLLKQAGSNLKAVQDSINTAKKPGSFLLSDLVVTISTEVDKVMSKTANVVGYLEGGDQHLKDHVLVIGAHMDHLGYGGPGSGSLAPDEHAIHNGADDNASGTAALLELLQATSPRQAELKRTIVFIAFSGEELGTLGSGYYVNHPLFPLGKTVAMLNMDMVGRLENKALTVYGTGTSPQWNGLLAKYNTDSMFVLKNITDGFGPSDHAQFYGKDIPVLFFFTGTHNDYHKPSDDWEKINYSGEEQVARYVFNIALDIDKAPEQPVFSKAQSSTTMVAGGDSRGFSVTLGIVPDYGESSEGMKIGSVRPNGPAEKAGMHSGDVIIKMAGKKILNIYDYMGVLGELKAGDEVQVEVLRDGKTTEFWAKMEKRQ